MRNFNVWVWVFVFFVVFFASLCSADAMSVVDSGAESCYKLRVGNYRVLRLSFEGGDRFIPKVASYDCNVIGGFRFDSAKKTLLPSILRVDGLELQSLAITNAPKYITMESMSGDGKCIAGKVQYRLGKNCVSEFAFLNLESNQFVFVGDLFMENDSINQSKANICREESIIGISFDGCRYVGHMYCGQQRCWDWAYCGFFADTRQRGGVKEIIIDQTDGLPFHVAGISSNGCDVVGFKYCQCDGMYKSYLFSTDKEGDKILAIGDGCGKSLFATSISSNGHYVAGRSKGGFWIWDRNANDFSYVGKSYCSFSPRFVSDDGKVVAGEMNCDDWTVRASVWINGEFIDIMRLMGEDKCSSKCSTVVSMSPDGYKFIVLAGRTRNDMSAFLVEREYGL